MLAGQLRHLLSLSHYYCLYYLILLIFLEILQVVLNLGNLQNSHDGRISCLGMSSDGSALCTGSWDKNLKVRTLEKDRFHMIASSVLLNFYVLDTDSSTVTEVLEYRVVKSLLDIDNEYWIEIPAILCS